MESTVWKKPPLLATEYEEDALEHLKTYFDGTRYSGSYFERLGGGGDQPAVADRITSDDLLALAMLSVPVQGAAARELLEGHTARKVSALLARVPTTLHITDPAGQAALRAEEGPLIDLWCSIRAVPTFGPVRTSKLLARKRPHLVPIYDRVVRDQFGAPHSGDQWTDFAQLVQDEEIVNLLLRLRSRANLEDISLLRILDVVVWMEGKKRGALPADEAPSVDPDTED